MDVWVVAAAAGAGYIAQHCKKLLNSKHDLAESSLQSPSFVRTDPLPRMCQVLDNSCSSPVETPRKKLGECAAEGLSLNDSQVSVENLGMSCGSDNFDLTFRLQSDKEIQEDKGGNMCHRIDERGFDSSLPHSTAELPFSYATARKKSNLRSKTKLRHLIKPLNSLESCFMAHIYKERDEVEDYIFSSNSSPTVRPFVVTDGSKIINRPNSISLNSPRGYGHHKLQDAFSQTDTVFGVSQLPNVESMELRRKAKVKDRSGVFCGSIKLNNERNNSLPGSSHGQLLFYLGISMGMVFSFWKNKKEVDTLNEKLRRSESLVQDLNEELEMKDSFSVEVLGIEKCVSQETHNGSSSNAAKPVLSPEGKLDKSSTNYDEDSQSQKTKEESMSRIEAELVAELERLELNMSSSKLEGRLAELTEFDQDFVPDFAEGELRLEPFRTQAGGQPYADEDGTATWTPQPVDYAVSPRELSIGLHEVLQSQLEDRVNELETALQKSESKVRYMEAELVSSWRDSSGSSSAHSSPITKAEKHTTYQPVQMNLSGEALDAYHEAYNLFTRLSDSEEKDFKAVTSGVEDSNPGEKYPNFGWIENDWMNDEYEDGSGEIDKLLIRQFVEKAREGSPAALKVQRALLSLDDNEH